MVFTGSAKRINCSRQVLLWYVSIISLFVVSCAGDEVNETVQEVIDREQAEELALEKAKTDPDIVFDPYSVTEAGFDQDHVPDEHFLHQEFKNYYFLYVWSREAHSDHCPYAVSKEGFVFKLSKEFNKLTADRGLLIENAEEGLELIRFYLVFNVALPGTDKHLLLYDLNEIPGIEEGMEEYEQYRQQVKAPLVKEHNSGWSYEFHTWQLVRGRLLRWEAFLDNSGTLDVQEKNEIETHLGQYVEVE